MEGLSCWTTTDDGEKREQAHHGSPLPSPSKVGSTPEYHLPPGAGVAAVPGVAMEVVGEEAGGDEYDIARTNMIRFTAPNARPRSSPVAGRKRRLPLDKSLVLTGTQMKAQLADPSDVTARRVKPRDRVCLLAGEAMVGESAAEARLKAHAMSGQMGRGLEESVFGLMMKPIQRFALPIAKKRVREEDQEGVVRPGGDARHEEEEEEDEEEQLVHGGYEHDDDFRMDDWDYYYQGPTGDEAEEAQEEAEDDDAHATAEGEEGEEEEDNGFIRTNAAGGDEAGEETTTLWHPNTVRMCKLLRARVAASAQQRPAAPPVVPLSAVTRNARRTKAANLFWEVLQLKTWDFIECNQEHAYDDIQIVPAARFHEAIPGEEE